MLFEPVALRVLEAIDVFHVRNTAEGSIKKLGAFFLA